MIFARFFRQSVKVVAVSVAILLGLATGPAMAAGADSVPPGGGTLIQTGMTLDCVHMTAKARQYADAHALCPAAGAAKAKSNTVVPMDINTGNCGDAWMWVNSTDVSGYGSFNYGFNSSQGNVVYRSLAIGYSGSYYSDGFNDGGWMNDYWYGTGRVIFVGPGQAYASLGGSVTLWWGGSCNIIPTNGSGWV